MALALLVAVDPAAAALAALLGLEDVFALALGSSFCKQLSGHALRNIKLMALGGKDPGSALRRLTQSSLTDRGAAIIELDAGFCRSVGTDILKALPKLPALRVLNLDGCQEVDDDGLAAVAQRCPALRSFSLYWNVRATDKGLCRLLKAQQGKQLRFLMFSGVKHLSDETVQRIVSRGPQLEILDLTRCNQVTDVGALLVCECLDNLQVLRFYAMAQLGPPAFTKLSRLVHLQELDLCGCRIEDDAVLEFLEASAPSKLHTLNLTWCPALTDATALVVARQCPRLIWLSYFGNTNITGAAIAALAAGPCGPSVRYLDVRGLTQASEYLGGLQVLQRSFPAVEEWELHH